MTQSKIKKLAASSTMCIALATASWTTSATAQTAPADQEAEASSGVEDIIVTAQKRNESVQDVPISIVDDEAAGWFN